MNLIIDLDCCTACGICVELCPGNVLDQSKDGAPYERYSQDCWYCGVCQIECPEDCISLEFPYLIR